MKASAVLDITLTKRGKTQGDEISMCGVPFHSCENLIWRLIRAGHKVAICEQTETPEQAKGVVDQKPWSIVKWFALLHLEL